MLTYRRRGQPLADPERASNCQNPVDLELTGSDNLVEGEGLAVLEGDPYPVGKIVTPDPVGFSDCDAVISRTKTAQSV